MNATDASLRQYAWNLFQGGHSRDYGIEKALFVETWSFVFIPLFASSGPGHLLHFCAVKIPRDDNDDDDGNVSHENVSNRIRITVYTR